MINPFSKINPELRLAWSASSLGNLVCMRKYYYSSVKRYRRTISNIDLEWGSVYHEALEGYDKTLKALGKESALLYALRVAFSKAKACPIILASEENTKNLRTLIRTIIWYVEEYGDTAPALEFPNGVIASELEFALPLGMKASTGEDYLIYGKLDGILDLGDELWIRERKSSRTTITSKSFYLKRYHPDTQMSTYDLAGHLLFPDLRLEGVMIEQCQTAVGFARFRRHEIRRVDAQREEFLRDIKILIKQAETCLLDGYMPKNEKACDANFGCDYRKYCDMNPLSRDVFMKSELVRMDER